MGKTGNDISDLLLGISGIFGKINDFKNGGVRKNIFGMTYKKTRSQRRQESADIDKGMNAAKNLVKKAYKKISETEFKNPFATKTKNLKDNGWSALEEIKKFIELTKDLQKLGHDEKNHDFEKLSRKTKDESKKLFKKIDTALKKLNKICNQNNISEDNISELINNAEINATELKDLLNKYATIHDKFINDANNEKYNNLLNLKNEQSIIDLNDQRKILGDN